MPLIPADTYQLAKLIVDLATGEAAEEQPTHRPLGGVGSAKLTAEQRPNAPGRRVAARWSSV